MKKGKFQKKKAHASGLKRTALIVLCLVMLGATIGATIAPWMIFLAQNNVVDRGEDIESLPFQRLDAVSGAVVSCLVAWFIIITTGITMGTGMSTGTNTTTATVTKTTLTSGSPPPMPWIWRAISAPGSAIDIPSTRTPSVSTWSRCFGSWKDCRNTAKRPSPTSAAMI